MSSFYTYLAVAAGGAVGSLGRFTLAGQVMRWVGPGFPWGTMACNVLGGLVMGIITELFALKLSLPRPAQAGLAVGVMGGFTTFSSFSLETVLMIDRHQWAQAFAYTAGSVVLCVGAVLVGMTVVRTLG
ncbi:MAG: fluoride efflux transporter CrcB [Alphaproteobacteria bacterium]|nr:fluoride efflux transporter CrcB [Alphaproteobacteria bacterium]